MRKILIICLAIISINSFASTTYFSDGTFAVHEGDMTYYSDGSRAITNGDTTYYDNGTSSTTMD